MFINAKMNLMPFKSICKGEDVLYDMVINVYNPFLPKLIDTHTSIKNELLIIFKLNKLKIKAFNEFIRDPPFVYFKNKDHYI